MELVLVDGQAKTWGVGHAAYPVLDRVALRDQDVAGQGIVLGTEEIGQGTADVQLQEEADQGASGVRGHEQALRPGSRSNLRFPESDSMPDASIADSACGAPCPHHAVAE